MVCIVTEEGLEIKWAILVPTHGVMGTHRNRPLNHRIWSKLGAIVIPSQVQLVPDSPEASLAPFNACDLNRKVLLVCAPEPGFWIAMVLFALDIG
jgi:hypothetical protein